MALSIINYAGKTCLLNYVARCVAVRGCESASFMHYAARSVRIWARGGLQVLMFLI